MRCEWAGRPLPSNPRQKPNRASAKRLSRSDITEENCAPRAGSRRQIGTAAAPGLVRQDGEGDSFLGVGIDAEAGGTGDASAGQECREVTHDQRVVNAAAGDDEV